MSTVELDESAPESAPDKEEVTPEEDVGPAIKRNPEPEEEPAVEKDSSSKSVKAMMADWREDLEAFQQMEKDEL